jgi:hypothetical protein
LFLTALQIDDKCGRSSILFTKKLENRAMKKIIFLFSLTFLLFGMQESVHSSNTSGFQESGTVSSGKLEKEVKPGSRQESPPIPGIDPALDLTTEKSLQIIIYLKDQPHHEISQEIKGRFQDEFDRLTSEIDEINRKYTIETPSQVDPQPSALSSSDKAAIDLLNNQIKDLIKELRRQTVAEVERRTGNDQENLKRYIESLGGRAGYGYTIVNAVAARIPGVKIGQLASHASVGFIVKDGLLEGHLNTSTYSIRANTFWNAGYTGYFSYGGVIDSGIDSGHPSLSWHTHRGRVFHDSGQWHPAYNDNTGTTDDLQGHGTHVGGIVWSRGNNEFPWDWRNYKGMAYGTYYKCINGKAGWRNTSGSASMYWSDGMKAIDWAINTEYADAINLSYGGATSSDETSMSRFFDAVVDDENIPCAISAGNDGPGSYTLGDPSISYNAFCVAAMDDRNNSNRGDDVVANYSSRGPTRGKDRKKPDIITPGSNIASCAHNWEGWPFNPDFVSFNGTSMAAPHLMGAVLLYKQAVGWWTDSKIIKAVFLNTAEDRGSADWDRAYGWGYLDLDHAYIHRSHYHTSSVRPSGQTGDYKLYRGTMYNGDKATLVWHRHADYRGANYPTRYYNLNDLDLRLYSHSNGSQLDVSWEVWDNVEQVKATATNSVVAKVEAFSSSFQGVSSEPYALATEEGFSAVSPPALQVSVNNPPRVGLRKEFTVSVPVRNAGGCNAFNTQVRLTLPPGFSIVSGANPQNVGTIGLLGVGTATWTVKAPNFANTYTLIAGASSNSYGETYTGSGTSSVKVVSTLDIVENSLSDSYTPANPWTQDGLLELSFHVTATLEDLTKVEFFADPLQHTSLPKMIPADIIEFEPEEIGHLSEDDTVRVVAMFELLPR